MFVKPPSQRAFTLDTEVVGVFIYQKGTVQVVRRVRGSMAARTEDGTAILSLLDTPARNGFVDSKGNGGKRGEIVEFSFASRARLAFIVSETNVSFCSMFTGTIPVELQDVVDGAVFKRALNTFNSRLRARGVDYLWFLEFTKRGLPHVHYLLTTSPETMTYRGKTISAGRARESIASGWYNAVKSSVSRPERFTDDLRRKMMYVHAKRHSDGRYAWEAIHRRDGAKRYALKYGLKMAQKRPPQSVVGLGRCYGYSRSPGIQTFVNGQYSRRSRSSCPNPCPHSSGI